MTLKNNNRIQTAKNVLKLYIKYYNPNNPNSYIIVWSTTLKGELCSVQVNDISMTLKQPKTIHVDKNTQANSLREFLDSKNTQFSQ